MRNANPDLTRCNALNLEEMPVLFYTNSWEWGPNVSFVNFWFPCACLHDWFLWVTLVKSSCSRPNAKCMCFVISFNLRGVCLQNDKTIADFIFVLMTKNLWNRQLGKYYHPRCQCTSFQVWSVLDHLITKNVLVLSRLISKSDICKTELMSLLIDKQIFPTLRNAKKANEYGALKKSPISISTHWWQLKQYFTKQSRILNFAVKAGSWYIRFGC